MNLEQVNTPQDLVEQNNTQTDEERVTKLLSSVLEEGPKVGLEFVKILVEKLETFHVTMLKDKIEDEDMEQIVFWTTDLTKLQNVMDILKDVQF